MLDSNVESVKSVSNGRRSAAATDGHEPTTVNRHPPATHPSEHAIGGEFVVRSWEVGPISTGAGSHLSTDDSLCRCHRALDTRADVVGPLLRESCFRAGEVSNLVPTLANGQPRSAPTFDHPPASATGSASTSLIPNPRPGSAP